MPFVELFIIIFLIFFQSIFGIGLLLFGTPTFLLLDYNFLYILNLLLPISITISLIQIFSSKTQIKTFKINFNLYCLPFLIASLFFLIKNINKIDIEIYVSFIIIIFSILNLNKKKFIFLKNFTETKQKIVLILIGIIHGLTNLGGSILTIFSSMVNKGNKEKTRHSIAYGYSIMAFFQILVLYFFSNNYIVMSNLLYIGLVFLIYYPTQKIFNKFKSEKFFKLLNIFALFFGSILLLKKIYE